MELQELPEHLLVLGGGYVGLEFGQMFRRFGSNVTVVQHGKQLLNREDPDVAAEVCKLLQADGIEIVLETEAVGVVRKHSGIGLELRSPAGERTVTGSHLLLATGRVPNSEQLELRRRRRELRRPRLHTGEQPARDERRGIYALGDVKGGPAFTHISYDDYRIVRNNLLRGGQSSTEDRLVPYTVYIDPQLGRIGLTEQGRRGHRTAQSESPRSRRAGSPAQWETARSRLHQSHCRCRNQADSWGRCPGRRRGRDHVDAADCHDGQSSLHRARRRHLRATRAWRRV